MADKHDRRVCSLGDLDQPRGHFAHLADRAGRAREVGAGQRLHRVDNADIGPLGLNYGEHRVEIGFSENGNVERTGRGAGFESLGAEANLRRGFLTGDVERAAPRCGHQTERHRYQGRLAYPRSAAEQNHRTGDDPATEQPVELSDAGCQARRAVPGELAQHYGAGGGAASANRPLGRRP